MFLHNNLDETQMKALKNLKPKIVDENLVCYKTDKTGKLALDTIENYSEKHIKNDKIGCSISDNFGMSFALPNFHSMSDCCWKWRIMESCLVLCYLNPLICIWHHSNQEVDQDNSGDQHINAKNKLIGNILRFLISNLTYLEKVGETFVVLRCEAHFLIPKSTNANQNNTGLILFILAKSK